jgi:NADH:ubiquinone oxidoreductase subunit
MAMDHALVAQTHYGYLQRDYDNTRRQYEFMGGALESLKHEGHRGRLVRLDSMQTPTVRVSDWKEWVMMHADAVCANHPRTREAREFKDKMINTMNMWGFQSKGQSENTIVALDFACGASQFIFGYVAVFAKRDGIIHVLVSQYGKQFQMNPGHNMQQPFWQQHTNDVKAYLRHGAVKQALQELAPYAQGRRR